MKTLKTIAVLALFMVGSVSFAQGPGQGGGRQTRSATERAKSETERLVTALALDEAQTAKILEINLKYAVQDSIMHQNNSGAQMDREKMMQDMRTRQEAKSTEVQAILKEDQIVKYKKFLEERQQRNANQRGQGTPGGEPRQ